MAPPLDDITRLLADLAGRLSGPPAGGGAASARDSLSASISSLAAALDPDGGASSGTSVLDAALSLMCFDPLEARRPPRLVVNRARVDCLVQTLVSALRASVSCRVVRPDGGAGEEMLCVGSSVSPGDCRELVRSCAALVEKLGDCDAGRHSSDLLYAVVKTAVLSPHYQCLFPLPYYKEEGKTICDMEPISMELMNHPSSHVLPSDHSVPLRLLLWHLDPSIVKHDLSVMLQEGLRFCARTSQCIGIISVRHSSQAKFMGISYINALDHFDYTRTGCSSQKNLQPPSKGLVKYNSAWCMVIDFPVWFNFATALLFHREGSQDYLSETLSKETSDESISDVSLAQRAAFYLSWVLCPSNDQRQMLANNILEISHSWARNNKKHPSYHCSTVHRRKLRLSTAVDSEKLHVPTNSISSLIEEFDDRCVKFCSTTAFPRAQDEKLLDGRPTRQNLLHLWIPLGVLLVSSNCLNEQNCDMLLRYTSTGQVLGSNEAQIKTKKHGTNGALLGSCGGTVERWALSGAYLIFGWLDLVEDMSSVIFDCEDKYQHFISQLQTKTGPYLLKCVKLIFEELDQADQDRDFVTDLHNRLLKWNKNGKGCEIFADAILEMNNRFNLPL
ncbi:hypothetical protein U9M48_029742 [Paspalum notatum var. saurae]|uniref:Uncharacterized protein n=1 Tax=Paspalum notatum var. saurae TaxID=547442 RepID=A0AAQ3TZ34_PASNO